ncbi:multiheme c-type cytochrome [Novosphingobium sp. BL-8A]|uniref:LVIVD repeat-containing protein n=1 Tax=Novosphingobium sp. BL-8A TaxID=3127639 RepID=UPI00375762C5
MRLGRLILLLALLVAFAIPAGRLVASSEERPVPRDYALVRAPAAPARQSAADVMSKSAGCLTCHTDSDAPSMHASPAVQLGCVDCHGGNAAVRGRPELGFDHPDYVAARDKAHVLPRYPHGWNWPSSANPERSYTLLNKEAPEYIRFVNPGDYRVARDSCGNCHMPAIEAAERSLMATGAMLWGGAAYNNGIAPFKNYIFGEAYTAHGEPAKVVSPGNPPGTVTPAQQARGALAALYPLPTWNVTPPADVFRVFEQGGRTNGSGFAEVGLPNLSGSIQRLEEPGRPDLKQSNRGPGTGLRVAIPVLNIHKTRLNDPYTWFMGTNDQPGDYRSSGCTACHVIYANDREPRHSLIYAGLGRDGQSITRDPTIAALTQRGAHGALKDGHEGEGQDMRERGHPLQHVFTRAIPTAQCMNCHMHQPNIFLNSYLGYTMWDYEADAPKMWPEKQKYPTAAEVRAVNDRNPEGAAPRGKWGDVDFLRNLYDLNPELKDTQFADYHGHGWAFRAIFKRDRAGNLLDAGGNMATWGTDKAHIVSPDDPEKWRRAGEGKFVKPGVNPGKAVHMMDIHAEKGMQCADCHFAQDAHGNGLIQGEVANAVEIGCKDCHGTADALPTLLTSGPAAPPKGTDLSLLRNPDGQRRFEWRTDAGGRRHLTQRSVVDPNLSWDVKLVVNAVDPASPEFNAKAARAKLMSRSGADDGSFRFGPGVAMVDRAHKTEEMACFTCHLSWTTSCGGCHLPIEANWKTSSHHFEGEETRNFATYNPQVARDDMFQLGKHMTTKGAEVAPVRSTSALVLSSTNANRERIYIQQPPISAAGFSSQAFAPHFPHTVRLSETKTCSDCHLSDKDDNNAIMAQTLLLGTNFVNFVGLNSWVGLEGGFEAVRVTEWDEPQAVIGSYLQRYAYPDYWRLHVEQNGRELKNWTRGSTFDGKLSGETHPLEQFRNVTQGTGGQVGCLQLRGEYMFVAEGTGGFKVYDVASVANKGVSDAVISAPFSPLGHDTGVKTKNATCMAIATTQPVAPTRNRQMAATMLADDKGQPLRKGDGTPMSLRDANQEQAFEPIYSYAVVTDSEEGLILVDIDTMADGDFRNNRLTRALTWNPDHVLDGARHVTLAGEVAYITAKAGLVAVDLHDPLHPKVTAVRPLDDARASAVQFRYLWVTDREGLKLFDVTDLRNPVAVPSGTVPLTDARRLYVARTYAYVAGGPEGLVIVDVLRPPFPQIYRKETFGGVMNDVSDVVVGSTNASLFAYVADGRNGLKVVQLTSPSSQPNFYGFSPAPMPELIAWARTPSAARALSKGLDRDRAVDETGGQIAVFGRLGSRPFTRPEMERLFLNRRGVPFKVSDEVDMRVWVPRQ